MFSHDSGKRVGRWWAARSSKPVEGMRNLLGGFDSHALPPIIYSTASSCRFFLLIFTKNSSRAHLTKHISLSKT
jgi:hypothetical protein